MQLNGPILSVEDLPRVSTSRSPSEFLNGHVKKSSTSHEIYQINQDDNNVDFYKTLFNENLQNLHEFDPHKDFSSANPELEPTVTTAMLYPQLYSNFGYESEIECFLKCLTSALVRNTSCVIFIIFGLFLLLSGCSYYEDCPSEPSIPQFIILGGIFLLTISFSYIIIKTSNTKCYIKYPNITNLFQKIFSISFVVWFIFGNIVVIFKHKTSEFRVIPMYVLDNCHPFVYWVAYSLLASSYIFVTCVFIIVLFLLTWQKCLRLKKLARRSFRNGGFIDYRQSLNSTHNPDKHQFGQLLVNYNVCNYERYGECSPYTLTNESSPYNR